MRNTLRTAILAALFLAAAGCSQYDRDLMGEPEPKEPVNPTSAQPQPANEAAYEDTTMDVGMFHDLDGYGQWFERDPYGWVWRPTAVIDWQPFTRGHWIWTSYGWMWVDYDPWGWATSHYGYWYSDFTLGWVWVPDYTWSPVQCDWMLYGDYIGWSPVSPPGASYKEPWDGSKAWVWVPVRKFKQTDIGEYRATPKFKPGDDANIQRGAPALAEVERRGAGMFSTTSVTLDRRIVRDREFAKVKYPPDQQEIIAERRTVPVKSSAGGFSAPPSMSGGSADWNPPTTSVGPTQPAQQPSQPATGKSKGTSKPADSGKTTTKYKSQGAKKDAPKSKDDTPSSKKDKG